MLQPCSENFEVFEKHILTREIDTLTRSIWAETHRHLSISLKQIAARNGCTSKVRQETTRGRHTVLGTTLAPVAPRSADSKGLWMFFDGWSSRVLSFAKNDPNSIFVCSPNIGRFNVSLKGKEQRGSVNVTSWMKKRVNLLMGKNTSHENVIERQTMFLKCFSEYFECVRLRLQRRTRK